MLFNSFPFIFAFLPATLVGYLLIGRWKRDWAAGWLVAASLLFYAYWDPRYLPLLLISAVTNFFAGLGLAKWGAHKPHPKPVLLVLSIGFNLALLGYFKYANFFVANLATAGLSLAVPKIILPLGISFFTFTQIAFLVDAWRGEAREPKFLHYLLFVTYFPHLIAGPILHHKEMMPQFARAENYRANPDKLISGLVIFIIGLFKKVVLADGISVFAAPVFNAAAKGLHFAPLDAWSGALAYTFQLYFDFSGYCDMAIGASLMFGIALPLNFDSPYKSLSIIEFWRRWHMTLSRFLRDYLYIPLGGNRKGEYRRYLNLFITMLLGGLWHGAGWTFVIWGALHGIYLAINHAISAARGRLSFTIPAALDRAASWLITFLAVVVAWVFFRADSAGSAFRILEGMGHAAPSGVALFHQDSGTLIRAWAWCCALLAAALLMPNTQEIMRDHLPALTRPAQPGKLLNKVLSFEIAPGWAVAIGLALCFGLACLPQPTNFLYFNF